MKKIKLIAFTFIVTVLAGFTGKNGFTITGHITGVEDGTWVKLYDLNQQRHIDSALTRNGKFVLKGKVSKPITCWIQCKDEYAILQVENTAMTFKSPFKGMFLNHIAQGGREQGLQNELNMQQRKYDVVNRAVYDSLSQKKYTNDAHKQKLMKQFNESQKISKSIYINFGQKNPNSYLGVRIIYMNRADIPRDSLKLIYASLKPVYREMEEAKALHTFLNAELAQKGKTFIDFKAKTLTGDDFTLSSLKGKYIYLSFWDAGCGFCIAENQLLSKNLADLPKDLVLVNFSTDKNSKAWERASKRDNITWHNVSDLEGPNGRIKTQYQVQGIPSSFLIDKNGVIVEHFLGYDADLVQKLKAIINGAAASK